MVDATGTGRTIRILFYVQHLLGIGHLVRASRIAQAMVADGMEVTLVTGGNAIEGFPGPQVRHVQLPSILASSSSFSGLSDVDGQPVTEEYEKRRRDMLIEAFRDAAPQAVIIEAFPFGRRQMRFELLPLLKEISAAIPRPVLLSSVRDILQENRKPGRDEETVDLIQRYFDGILVHGDPQFVRLEQTFPLASSIADKVYYTGLVAPGRPAAADDHFDVVVSAGGGAVGGALLRAALEAQRRLGDNRSWCVIAGPNLPQSEFEEMRQSVPENVTLSRFRTDFPNLLANAKLSISQAGYNTVCDLLRVRCPAVLVPFASGGETEQSVRAAKLEELGLAQVVAEGDLSGVAMADAIANADKLQFPEDLRLSLEGAHETTAIIRQLLSPGGQSRLRKH